MTSKEANELAAAIWLILAVLGLSLGAGYVFGSGVGWLTLGVISMFFFGVHLISAKTQKDTQL